MLGYNDMLGITVLFLLQINANNAEKPDCTECEKDCQTAYAFDSENPLRNLCLMEFTGFINWGWIMINFNINNFISDSNSDSETGEFEYNKIETLDIYAGATECDLDNGIIVGEIELSYNNNRKELLMKYISDSPFYFASIHSYVGFDTLPRSNNDGNHSPIPTDYPNIYQNINGFNQYTFTFDINDIVSSNHNFNIIAHANVKKMEQITEFNGNNGSHNDNNSNKSDNSNNRFKSE